MAKKYLPKSVRFTECEVKCFLAKCRLNTHRILSGQLAFNCIGGGKEMGGRRYEFNADDQFEAKTQIAIF